MLRAQGYGGHSETRENDERGDGECPQVESENMEIPHQMTNDEIPNYPRNDECQNPNKAKTESAGDIQH
jgi:hypothetical protein